MRVLELPGLLEVVDDPSDLVVGVLGEAGEDLGHAREEPLFLVGERVPRPDVVVRRIRSLGHRVERRELGAFGHDALLDHPAERPLAVGLVAVVELALVLVGPLRRDVMRRVIGPRAEPGEPGPRRSRNLDVADHLDRVVRQILGEVVALLRLVRLVDQAVVLDQRRIPVVRLAPEEAVEAIPALVERPVRLRRAGVGLLDRHVVVLADPERAPAGLAHHLGESSALRRDVPVRPWESRRGLGDAGHPVLVVVAPGQEARARWRAERRCVPLRVRQAVVGEALQGRHLDPAAVGRPGSHAGVVVEHDEDVRRPLGCLRWDVRLPVRRRVPDVGVDDAFERLAHLGPPCSATVNGRGQHPGSRAFDHHPYVTRAAGRITRSA